MITCETYSFFVPRRMKTATAYPSLRHLPRPVGLHGVMTLPHLHPFPLMTRNRQSNVVFRSCFYGTRGDIKKTNKAAFLKAHESTQTYL